MATPLIPVVQIRRVNRRFLHLLRERKHSKNKQAYKDHPFFTTFRHYKMYKKGCTKKILVYFNTSIEKDFFNDREPHENRRERDRHRWI